MAGRIWTQMSDPALNELIFLEEAEAKGSLVPPSATSTSTVPYRLSYHRPSVFKFPFITPLKQLKMTLFYRFLVALLTFFLKRFWPKFEPPNQLNPGEACIIHRSD